MKFVGFAVFNKPLAAWHYVVGSDRQVREMDSPSPHDNARRDVDLIPSDWHQNSAVLEIADGKVSTDRLRRVSPIAVHLCEGRLAEPTPAVQPTRQERLFVPQSGHCPTEAQTAQSEGTRYQVLCPSYEGSAIIREFSTSSTVIGVLKVARGFFAAHSAARPRPSPIARASSHSSSLAQHLDREQSRRPHWPIGLLELAARLAGATTLRVRPTPERPLSLCVISTVSHRPEAIAAAWRTWIMKRAAADRGAVDPFRGQAEMLSLTREANSAATVQAQLAVDWYA